MTAEGDPAVFHADGDGVEGVAVEDAVISQLFLELARQFFVGQSGAGDLDQVAHRGDAPGLAHTLPGVGLVLVEVHAAGQGGDALVHADLHIAKLLFIQPRRRIGGRRIASPSGGAGFRGRR